MDCTPAPPVYDADESTWLMVVTQIGAWLSFFGSFLIIISWSLFAALRNGSGSGSIAAGHHGRMVVALAVANMGGALGKIFSTGESASISACPAAWCVFTGAWVQFFEFANLMWICIISFDTLSAFTIRRTKWYRDSSFCNKTATGAWTRELIEHAIAWGSSALATLGPALSDSYGDAGNWCWLKDDHHAARIGWQVMELRSSRLSLHT